MAPGEHPFVALLRLLGASLRVGRFFGTEVRVYGAWLILLLLIVLPLDELAWLPIGARLLYLVGGALMLYVVVWLHEMGHVVAGWRWHIHTPVITLSPLGGLAHMGAAAPHPRAEMVISFAGPATHALLLAPAWALMRLAPEDPVVLWMLAHHAFDLNLALLVFNLLPFYPLDGGRALRAGLAMRMHPNRATLWTARLGIAGGVGLMVYGLAGLGGLRGGLLMMIGLSNVMASMQALREARWSDGPYGEPRLPWETDPDAWKHGRASAEDVAPAPTPRASREPPAAASDEELDRLLDRVRSVGLAGLTETERAALQRASRARRGQP